LADYELLWTSYLSGVKGVEHYNCNKMKKKAYHTVGTVPTLYDKVCQC